MPNTSSLQVGDEVDYCPVGSFWVPARVQDILLPDSSASSSPSAQNASNVQSKLSTSNSSSSGSSGSHSHLPTTLLLRFSCGDSDVTHAVDIHNSSDAKKIAPACEYSLVYGV
jgi:hypothetical protein